MFSHPCLIVQTPLALDISLLCTSVRKPDRSQWDIDAQYNFPAMIAAARTGDRLLDCLERRPLRITIDHGRGLIFRLSSKVYEEHYWHCAQVVRGMGNFEPKYPVAAAQETTRRVRGRS